MSKLSIKPVKGEKIKRGKPSKPPKRDVPIDMSNPDCDKPKEKASQLKKNIKNKNVNQSE